MEKKKFIKKLIMLLILSVVVNSIFFDSRSNANLMYADMYGYNGNIDVIFIGSSVIVNGCNPDIADKLLQQNTFNAGTINQIPQGSFYLIKEVAKRNTLKTVFLNMFFVNYQAQNGNISPTYLLNRGMENSFNKYSCLWDAGQIDGIVNVMLPVLNAHVNPMVVFNNKLNGVKAFFDINKNGYVPESAIADENTKFEIREDINPIQPISDYSYEYLVKITDYCKKNDIELILIVPPIPDASLINEKYYENYTQFVKTYAVEQNIRYWDFNLSKEIFLTMDISEYADNMHLNNVGADKFTESLAKLYLDIKSGDITEEDVFYDTYGEKIECNMDNTYKIES